MRTMSDYKKLVVYINELPVSIDDIVWHNEAEKFKSRNMKLLRAFKIFFVFRVD